MAIDITGNHINRGDTVIVPCVVVEVNEVTDEQPLNVTLETVYPPVTAGSPNRFKLAGRQIGVGDKVIGVSSGPGTTTAAVAAENESAGDVVDAEEGEEVEDADADEPDDVDAPASAGTRRPKIGRRKK